MDNREVKSGDIFFTRRSMYKKVNVKWDFRDSCMTIVVSQKNSQHHETVFIVNENSALKLSHFLHSNVHISCAKMSCLCVNVHHQLNTKIKKKQNIKLWQKNMIWHDLRLWYVRFKLDQEHCTGIWSCIWDE